MEFIRGIHNLKSRHRERGCVLAIGNFDGFHRGHRALISKLKEEGYNRKLPVMVMIFEPHPQEYFFGVSIRLSRLRDKVRCFSALGIDVLLCVHFNQRFSSLEADLFVSSILVTKLNVSFVCVGDNFRFGALRRGNFDFLKKMSNIFSFDVMKIDTQTDGSGERISSSAVRTALVNNQLMRAEQLLGHSYSLSGRVVCGTQVGGSIIGFPTLNVLLKGQRLPVNGVYAVEVYGIIDKLSLLGIANIGICPTIHMYRQQRLEVYLLDQLVNVYGYYVKVIIRAKIRDEKCFSSFETLRTQIINDIRSVRKYFNI